MSRQRCVRGLYVITDPVLCGDQLATKVAAAVAGGARLVQYRNKHADRQQQLREIRAIQEACGGRVPLIVNDDAELALETDADGVHVGQDCPDLPGLRARIGAGRLLGVTCHASLELARSAAAAGADYVAFGAFHPSPTKPQARRAPLALLGQARDQLPVPVVAIGGINADNAGALHAAGADCVAVISGVFAQPDPRDAALRIARIFTEA